MKMNINKIQKALTEFDNQLFNNEALEFVHDETTQIILDFERLQDKLNEKIDDEEDLSEDDVEYFNARLREIACELKSRAVDLDDCGLAVEKMAEQFINETD